MPSTSPRPDQRGTMLITPEHVLSLPAGPELDGLVDELVFQRDRTANTPARRSAGVQHARPQGVVYGGDLPDVFVFQGTRVETRWDRDGPQNPPGTPASECEPWVWLQRHGQPWQAAIEKYMAEFRLPPKRPWSGDIAAAWEVWDWLVQRGTRPEIVSYTASRLVVRLSLGDLQRGDVWLMRAAAETAPLALCRAAVSGVLEALARAIREPGWRSPLLQHIAT